MMMKSDINWSKMKDTIVSCSMLEGIAREKHEIKENRMRYEITLLYEIRRIDSKEGTVF